MDTNKSLEAQSSTTENTIVDTILHNPEILWDFLCMAFFGELVKNRNPNIPNLFVFLQGYEQIYRDLLSMEEDQWNVYLQKIVFDWKKFSDFFMAMYNKGIYGDWFLETDAKRNTILNIVMQREEDRQNLFLSRPFEDILDTYAFLDSEKQGITDRDDVLTFNGVKWDDHVYHTIERQLILQNRELQKELSLKLEKKVAGFQGAVQERVGKVIATTDGKDSLSSTS